MSGGRRPRVTSREQLVTVFWLTVDTGSPDECWLWGGYAEKGYGRYFDGHRMRGAHDLALEWFSGERRGEGLITCHNCNTPLCCNPHHLRFDTPASNVADMMAAGTHNPNRKLSDDEVRVIRERAAAGATGRALAAEYGVSEPLVTMIIRGTRRPNAPGPIRAEHGNKKASKQHAR